MLLVATLNQIISLCPFSRVPVLVLPPVPKDMLDDLMTWFDESQPIFISLKEIMISDFIKRTKRLREMPKKACDIFWWPFTQHKHIPEENVTVIDSRCGESFAIHKVGFYVISLKRTFIHLYHQRFLFLAAVTPRVSLEFHKVPCSFTMQNIILFSSFYAFSVL